MIGLQSAARQAYTRRVRTARWVTGVTAGLLLFSNVPGPWFGLIVGAGWVWLMLQPTPAATYTAPVIRARPAGRVTRRPRRRYFTGVARPYKPFIRYGIYRGLRRLR